MENILILQNILVSGPINTFLGYNWSAKRVHVVNEIDVEFYVAFTKMYKKILFLLQNY